MHRRLGFAGFLLLCLFLVGGAIGLALPVAPAQASTITVDIPLVNGWNFVAGAANSDFLGLVLFRYDTTPPLSYVSVLASNMGSGVGYEVRSTRAQTADVILVDPPISCTLAAGQNLIGNTSWAPVDVPAGYTAFAWDPASQSYFSTLTLNPGTAAWVSASRAATIQLLRHLTITGVSPTSGPLAGGTSVTITGVGFTGANAVKFGITNATTFCVDSDTQITALAPSHAVGQVDIRVTDLRGASYIVDVDHYTYVAAPTVTGLSPTSGPTAGGCSVTIAGSNLTAAIGVKFGSADASSFTVNSATQITATSPSGTGMVDVTVTTAGGVSATTSVDHYTYAAAPTVTGLSPASGPAAGGTSVTITGSNLTAATGVKFGSADASSFTVNSATQITATSPSGAGIVDVTVATAGGVSATTSVDRYTYVPAPTIRDLDDVIGPTSGGTMIAIRGTNFIGLSGPAAVKFGDTNARYYRVESSTYIIATPPAHVSGLVQVQVTASGGSTANTPADDYTYAVYELRGQVLGNNEGSVALAGAKVRVSLYADDPSWQSPPYNQVGTAYSDAEGNYVLDVSSIHYSELRIGTRLEVTASADGYKSMVQYGTYDRPSTTVSFLNFHNLYGPPWGDRRLPFDDRSIPPMPCEFLMPNYVIPLL